MNLRFAPLACFFALTTGAALVAEIPISDDDVPEEKSVKLEVLAEDLFLPWAITWLPDHTAIITEKRGTLRSLKGGVLSDPIDFPVAVTSGGSGGITRGQGGLMDVVASPDFAEDQLLYFTFSSGDPEANRTEVARATWTGEGLSDFEVVWRNPDDKRSGQHFGSRILFLPDGTMLVSIGDGGNPPVSLQGDDIRKQAQNPGTAFGKVLRLNPDGTIPADNPDFGSDALPGLWSYGHRNIQGLDRDAVTGDIWANEHGAFRGDELNLLQPGNNYGWPAATFSRNYGSRSAISDHTTLPEKRDAKLVWMKTHAPSGLVVYRGEAFPAWEGAVLSGGLRTSDIRVIKHAKQADSLQETRIAIGQRVRDVRVGPDGGLYALTDATDGQLIRVNPVSSY
jgi:aldose sugar dehydrogenase